MAFLHLGPSAIAGRPRNNQGRNAKCISRRLAADTEVARADLDLNSYVAGFRSVESEDSYEIQYDENTEIDGQVPADLRGTLFRVMPGKVDAQGSPLSSYWDGDGMAAAVSFGEDGVFVRNRFIRTKGYEKERLRKKMVYRGMFGSQKPGGVLANFAIKIKQAANRFGVYHGGRLLALHDWGLPYSVDPASLLTRGRTTVRAEFNENERMVPSARIDPSSKNLILASKAFSPVGMTLNFVEFNDDYRPQRRQRVGVSSQLLADFGCTERYHVVVQSPYRLDYNGLFFGAKLRVQDAISKTGGALQVVLVDRENGKVTKHNVPKSGAYAGHIAASYDKAEGGVVIDLILHDDLPLGQGVMGLDYAETVPRSSLYRIEVGATGDVTCESLSDTHCDFPYADPLVQGEEHRYVYSLTAGDSSVSPLRGISKIDTKTREEQIWLPSEGSSFCSAPVYVPREGSAGKGDDSGYIVTMEYDGASGSASVVVLDARSPQQGPLCRIMLREPLPQGLGSVWTDKTFTSQDATKYNSYEIFKNKGWNELDSGFSLIGLQGIDDLL